MTTEGWKLCIQCKYGSTNWVALKYTKKSYPFELEDDAKRMNIDDEPTFALWFPYVQRKREII